MPSKWLSFKSGWARSKHCLRHEDLVGFGNRLGPGGGVDHRADRRQVPMGMAELAKTEFAGVNADADPKFACIEAMGCNKRLAPFAPVLLNVARGAHGVPRMLVPHQGKIEDRHDGVADRLVEEPVMRPDRVRAFVVECVEQARDGIRRLRLRQAGVAAQIGKHDGRVDGDLAGPHHLREHQLADGAGIGVHSARTNAKRAKWRRDHTAKRHRDMHLLPAPFADSRLFQLRHCQQ